MSGEPEKVKVSLFNSVDQEIAGQKWCCISFVNPEEVCKHKDTYFFSEFVKQYEASLKSSVLESFLATTVKTINDTLETHAVDFEKRDLSGVALDCRNSKVRVDAIINNLNVFLKKNTSELTYDNMKDKFDQFMSKNVANLETEFYKDNNFTTSMRAIKVRGSFESSEEAADYAKQLHKKDPYFNIFVSPVGRWLPIDADPDRVQNAEYANEQLNSLMKKYKENIDAREEFYHENKKNLMKNAKVANETNDMFSSVGDLALQRKMNKQ